MSDAAHQPPADEGSSLGDAASHFTTEPGGTPAGPGRYVNVDELTPVEFLPGLGFRPVLGQECLEASGVGQAEGVDRHRRWRQANGDECNRQPGRAAAPSKPPPR